jgi:hypothetical protein
MPSTNKKSSGEPDLKIMSEPTQAKTPIIVVAWERMNYDI